MARFAEAVLIALITVALVILLGADFDYYFN